MAIWTDSERLEWMIKTQNAVFECTEPPMGWCVLARPNTYLAKHHTSSRNAIDAAMGRDTGTEPTSEAAA